METNDSYTSKVENGEWPEGSSVPLDPPFTDHRGTIQNILLKPVTSLAVISSKAGTTRANHYHRTDWHYAYVISGRVLYYERDVGSQLKPDPVEFLPGSLFFTPPMREHCMAFPEDTVILTAARNVRSHESHESDLVRVRFIEPGDLGL